MIQSSLLSMDNRTWYTRVTELVGEACDADAADEALVLREGLTLFSLAPYGQKARLGRLPSRERFETLLEAGAGESVALALLPKDAAYIVSRGGNGVNLASVMLDGDDEEVAAEAATAGLALLAAFAGALRFAAPQPLPLGDLAHAAAEPASGCLH